MDNKVEILLGSEKNINSINVNGYGKIELTNNVSELTEFTVNDIVNATEVFDAEREENQVYRIYGRIEYMSLLNGLKTNYSILKDFFNPQYTGNSKSILNSFDFYLVAPSSGTTYTEITNTNYHKRSFDVIAGKDDFEIYNAGFSNNIYGEQVYGFSFKSDFDVSNFYDKLGFPLTELFLYAQYKQQTLPAEQISYTTWSTTTGLPSKVTLNKKDLVVGDNVETNNGTDINDIIEYIPEEYFQSQISSQTFYIRTPYNLGSQWLEWSYNPLIPFKLRYLDGVVSVAKLAQIVESATTLNVIPISSPSNQLNAIKSTKQILSTGSTNIIQWSAQTSTYFDWIPSNGRLEFQHSGTYEIDFKTQIYLPDGTDKYIAITYLEQYNGSEWDEIDDTTRKYLITNAMQGMNIVMEFDDGDEIRIRTRLIPNPDERRMFLIPDYALMLVDDGKYVWRNILPQGYIDPITNLGVDYPFFNKRRYLFEPIVFEVVPNLTEDEDLEHPNTQEVFKEISYHQNTTTINITPITDLDDIEKPCQ